MHIQTRESWIFKIGRTHSGAWFPMLDESGRQIGGRFTCPRHRHHRRVGVLVSSQMGCEVLLHQVCCKEERVCGARRISIVVWIRRLCCVHYHNLFWKRDVCPISSFYTYPICPFMLQTMQFHVILITHSPQVFTHFKYVSLPCPHISPLPPPRGVISTFFGSQIFFLFLNANLTIEKLQKTALYM